MRGRCKKLFSKTSTAIMVSIVLGFAVGAVFLAFCGYDPIKSYSAMIEGIFSRPKYMAQVVIQSTPIILTGLSVAFAFKCGLFNIGAEGQYIIGVLTATIAGTMISLPPGLHFVFVLIVAMFASGIWGMIAGVLKAKFGISEVVTSIMLNWIAFYLYKYIFAMPWLLIRSQDTSKAIMDSAKGTLFRSFAESKEGAGIIERNSVLSDIFKTDLNYGIFIAIVVVYAIHFLLKKTTKGFELRAIGNNSCAAKFVGISVARNIALSMFISGAISGLAGAIQLTGISPYKMTNLAAFEGYGLEGIYVALVANCSPIGCIFSGLFFGAVKCGSGLMQVKLGTPREIIKIITGLIVFFIAIPMAHRFIIAKIRNKRQVKK